VKVGKEEYEMLIPKYACNKAIRDEFQNFCDWDLRLHDIFVIDFAEKKGLLEIPISVRGNGIPYRDFEFVLQKTEVSA
jgi:hypothetical protein